MATADFTATPKELSDRFPCTGRPFAVWYHPDAENNLHWNVNGENGESWRQFQDIAVALKTAAAMGEEWDEEARIQAQTLANLVDKSKEKTSNDQQHKSVRYAVMSITFDDPISLNFKEIETGIIFRHAAFDAAKNESLINALTPEDALCVGVWYGQQKVKDVIRQLTKEPCYINKHGVYVESHRKTNPNKTQRDNWSTKGHINPSNGKPGKKELRK